MDDLEAIYIYTDVCQGKNNNKVWRIKQDKANLTTLWGRVGDSLQSKTWNLGSVDKAQHEFDKKCKEKIRKGYTKVEAVGGGGSTTTVVSGGVLEDIAVKEIDCNNDTTRDLIKFLTKQNIHTILEHTTIQYNDVSGLFTTPLGVVVGQETINSARKVLVNIKNTTDTTKDLSVLEGLTNQYLRLIPQNLGRARNKLNVINIWGLNDNASLLLKLQQQQDILDSLESSLKTVLTEATPSATMPTASTQETERKRVFDCKLHHNTDLDVFKRIDLKFQEGKKSQHYSSTYKLDKVYDVDISSMRKAWQDGGAKLSNIMELWHGTNCSSLLSILKRGLVIPGKNIPVAHGKVFGAGVYFAPSSTKSLNYASGGVHSSTVYNKCWMILAKVSLGNYYTPKSSYDGPFPKPSYDSVWAKAGKTSGLINDECIIYNENQCNILYLCEFIK